MKRRSAGGLHKGARGRGQGERDLSEHLEQEERKKKEKKKEEAEEQEEEQFHARPEQGHGVDKQRERHIGKIGSRNKRQVNEREQARGADHGGFWRERDESIRENGRRGRRRDHC